METTKSARLLRIARDALARRASADEQEGGEAGFTLIELMVVLLIMAILLAIAIPTFLGVKGGAQDRAAQSNLSNALISAKATYATNSSYLTAPSMVATLNSQEPELTFTTGPVATTGATNQVSVFTASGQLILVDFSPANSGTCWALSDWDGSGTVAPTSPAPGVGTQYTAWKAASATSCQESGIPSGAKWSTAYPAAATA